MGVTATIGAAVVGAGTAAFGLYEKNEGDKAQAAAAGYQAAAAQKQAGIAGQQAGLEAQFAGSQAATSAQFAQREAQINAQASASTYEASARSSAINQQVIGFQQGIEGKRRTAMELTARRDQMEQFRQAQRARSTSLVAATGAGAQFGSGYQGAKAQISGQSGVNLTGIRQNLQLGRDIFGLNANISQQQIASEQNKLDLAYKQAQLQTQSSNLKAEYATTNATAVTDYSAQKAGLQAQYAQAGGQISTGAGMMAIGAGQSSFGQSLFSAGPTIFQTGVIAGPAAGSLFAPTPQASSTYVV